MYEYVAFDLETTGLSEENDEMIEVGAVKIRNCKIVGKYNQIINPHRPLTYQIIQLTGIEQELVDRGREKEEVLKEFLDFCDGYPLLGHNVMFDYRFMKTGMNRLGLPFEKNGADTYMIAKKLLKQQVKSKSLGSLCDFYHYTNQAAHRAYHDALATAVIYEKMKLQFPDEKEVFLPKQLQFKPKKTSPATEKQKRYLNDLLKYHKIKGTIAFESMTKSDASKQIDQIILKYGRMK
ncbi:MAG: PolC-type DNA polymerase III [Candidatus Fimousia sp.]|uniref:3'-5' exonuclease n=1 Tax=Anaerostipes sp. 992a TaxID=1261637 RepID=UPI0009512390|nr:3'-5' exonuclease [Anaerostipes sp. 992a]MDD5968694.1 3'-5' exonuclease [Anaerostipes sp.]OLR60945.1 DNA polymerase III subunit epsilon [Anaerostipes sp. 992a]